MALNLGNLVRLVRSKLEDDEGIFQKGKFVPQQAVKTAYKAYTKATPYIPFSPNLAPKPIRPIQQTREALQSFGQKFPRATEQILKLEKPIQKVSSFLQRPYKPVELPRSTKGAIVPRAGYNYLVRPLAEGIINAPSNYIGGVTKTGLSLGQKYRGEKVPWRKVAGNAAQVASAIMDVSVLPFAGGVAKNVAKEAGKNTLKIAIKEGAKSGAKFGGAYGLFGGLKDNRDIKDLFTYTTRVAGSTAIGAGGGAVLGGAVGGLSHKAGEIWNAIRGVVKKTHPNANEAEVVDISKRFFRDELGRFSGLKPLKKTEYVPIKKDGKVVDYLTMKRTYRTGKEPDWYPIIRKELGMPEKGFTAEDIPLGLSTKPLTKTEHEAILIQKGQQKIKIKPKDQQLVKVSKSKTVLKNLGWPQREINRLNVDQQQNIVNKQITYNEFKKDPFITGLEMDANRQPIKIKPNEELVAPTINTERGGVGDEASVRAVADKAGFDESFAKWIGKREAASTTGIGIGAKHKNIPEGVTGEQVIRYIENPKGEASPQVKQYAKSIRQQYNALYKNAKAAGIDMKYVNDYLTHIWDKPVTEVQQMYKSMGQKFGFANDRVLPTYEEGLRMGLKPKYTNPAQIIADYTRRLEQVKANVGFAKELEKQGYIVPKRFPGFEPITAPGFMGKTVKLGDGTIREGVYYAPPKIARQINRVFSESDSPQILQTTAKLSGGLQDITLSGGIPKTPLNAWTFAQTLKEVTSGRVRGPLKALWTSLSEGGTNKYIADNAQFIKEQQLNNISVRSTLDIDSLANKGTIERLFGKNVSEAWNKTVNEPTFKRFMPVLQTEFYKDVRAQALKKGVGEGEAIRIASQATKQFYGLTSTASLAKRSNAGRDVLSTLAFAPRYRESMVNFWLNNIKALKNPLALENRANVKFMAGATLMAIAYDQLNRKFNNGRSMLDNPKGTEDKLLIPVGNGDVIGIPYLSSIATMPRAMFREGKMLLQGDVSGAAKDALQSYTSMLIKPAADVLANENYFGEPIVEDNMTSGQKFIAQGQYLFKQYFLGHPYLKEVIDKKNQESPAYQRLSRAMELPFRFYTQKSLEGKYYYGARDEALKGLSSQEQQAFASIPKYDSYDPNVIIFKYQTYLTYPKVFEAKQQTELEMAEKTGKAIDPLYLVDYETAKKYMRYETLPPGSEDRKAMTKAYPELVALFDLRGRYFDENPMSGMPKSDRPLPSKYVQDQMDAKNWSDPEVRAYLDANRLYQNEQREKLGLPPLEGYSWGSKKSKKVAVKKTTSKTVKISESKKAKLPKVKIAAPPKILAERPQRKKYNFASITQDLPKKVRLTKAKRLGIVRPSTIRIG